MWGQESWHLPRQQDMRPHSSWRHRRTSIFEPLAKEKEAHCFQLKLMVFCVLHFPYKAGEGDLFSFPDNVQALLLCISSVSAAVNHVLHDPCHGTRIHEMVWGFQAQHLVCGVGCKKPAVAACWGWACYKPLLDPYKGIPQGIANIHGPESCQDTLISSAYPKHEQLGLIQQCFTE